MKKLVFALPLFVLVSGCGGPSCDGSGAKNLVIDIAKEHYQPSDSLISVTNRLVHVLNGNGDFVQNISDSSGEIKKINEIFDGKIKSIQSKMHSEKETIDREANKCLASGDPTIVAQLGDDGRLFLSRPPKAIESSEPSRNFIPFDTQREIRKISLDNVLSQCAENDNIKNLLYEYISEINSIKNIEQERRNNIKSKLNEIYKNISWKVDNIIMTAKDRDTGSVDCKATLKGSLIDGGASSVKITYKVERNSDGQPYVTVWGL